MEIIGHGVDLVEIARIGVMLREHGQRFRERCFTAGEQAYAEQASKRREERYAARFACKEAVLKALGTGWRDGIAWTDVEVVRDPSGQPRLRVGGRCADLAAARGIRSWQVSLTHAGAYAMASVIACGGAAEAGMVEDAGRR